MILPNADLRAATRPVFKVQIVNLAFCFAVALVAFRLRDSVPVAVWVRVTAMFVVALLVLFFTTHMYRGKRWAYIRVKWFAIGGTIGFVLVAALPGPFPVWMRAEHAVQALVFAAMAWLVTRPRMRAFFAKPASAAR